MPTISGSLNLVTDRPVDSISEVWVRARETRGQGDGLTVGVNDRVPVEGGVVEFPALPGAAVLVLVQNGMPLETLPMLITDEAQQSLRIVVQAGEAAGETDRRAIEQLAAEIAASIKLAEQYRTEAASSASKAKTSETAASKSASNAKTSETKAKTSETNAKTSETNAASSAASAKSQQESALTHFNNTVAEAGKAAGSAAAAKTSETKAASSASASASSASSSATQAGKSATSATQAGVARDAAKASETAAAGSASAAKTSETNAAQSSSSANTHRAAAAEQATAASQSATSAASARDAAKQSQTAAKTSETNAASYKKAAATSASNAATSETNAGASATASASSAAEAKGHADRAEVAADPDGLRKEMTKQFAALVDGAPEDLDTIREIAEYAQANRGITDQLNAAIGAKANKSHTHTSADISDTTSEIMSARPNRVVRTNGDGAITIHNHTITGDYSAANKAYVDGEVAKKADTGHKHTVSEITDFATEMGKKANTSHTHSQSQITGLSTALGGKADKAHTHDLATLPGRISNEQAPDVTIIGSGVDLNTYETTGVFAQNMNAYAAAGTNYPVDRAGLLEVAKSSGMTYQTYTVYSSGAMYYRGRYSQSWGPWKEVSTEGHTHSQSQVTGLTTALDGKAAKTHTHTTSQISGLGTALNGKADKTYVNSRPALFSGSGAPPSSIAGAVAGDFWLDTSTMELHKITGV